LKATISGVSVIKQLIPQQEEEDDDHTDVFRPSDGGIDHREEGMGLSFGPGEGTIEEQPEPDSRDFEHDEDYEDEEDDQVADTLLDQETLEQPKRPSMRRPTLGELSEMRMKVPRVSISVDPAAVSPHMPQTSPQSKPKMKRLMSQVFSRRDKRYPGLGFVSRCMGRARKSRVDSQVKQQLDEWQDHRYVNHTDAFVNENYIKAFLHVVCIERSSNGSSCRNRFFRCHEFRT